MTPSLEFDQHVVTAMGAQDSLHNRIPHHQISQTLEATIFKQCSIRSVFLGKIVACQCCTITTLNTRGPFTNMV